MTGVAAGAGEASRGMATGVESKGGTDGGGHRLGTNLNVREREIIGAYLVETRVQPELHLLKKKANLHNIL